MFGIYNMISIISGVAAVAFPLAGFFCKNGRRFSFWSMTAALLSLCSRISAYNILVRKGDWSALLDTTDFTLFASVALTLIVVILNLLLRLKSK